MSLLSLLARAERAAQEAYEHGEQTFGVDKHPFSEPHVLRARCLRALLGRLDALYAQSASLNAGDEVSARKVVATARANFKASGLHARERLRRLHRLVNEASIYENTFSEQEAIGSRDESALLGGRAFGSKTLAFYIYGKTEPCESCLLPKHTGACSAPQRCYACFTAGHNAYRCDFRRCERCLAYGHEAHECELSSDDALCAHCRQNCAHSPAACTNEPICGVCATAGHTRHACSVYIGLLAPQSS